MNAITAQANSNIAFIKYWGNRDDRLRIPLNGSISMNLSGLSTITTVRFDVGLKSDKLEIDGKPASITACKRVSDHLDIIRRIANINSSAEIISVNNFPMGAGIASSASAFAALSLAGSKAAGLTLDLFELSRLARRGSGSACRSIHGGIVEWYPGKADDESYADQLVPAHYWDLVDCLVIIDESHKGIGSSEGHVLSRTSPLQALRIKDATRRLALCRQAILDRDFQAFSDVVEQDSNMMHSVMCTSNPSLVYWNPVTFDVMKAVLELRKMGREACYTIDAGPNVHVITQKQHLKAVERLLLEIPGVLRIVVASVGKGVKLVD